MLKLGETSSMPRICVPLMGEKTEDLEREAAFLMNTMKDSFHVAEWRADYFGEISSKDAVINTLKRVKAILKEKELIFTYRTAQEGGSRNHFGGKAPKEKEIDSQYYFEINKAVQETGMADYIDLELEAVKRNYALVHRIFENIIWDKEEKNSEKAEGLNTKLIFSNHDFQKTPPQEEIKKRLLEMKEFGADIAKIAVMPHREEDVNILMGVLLELTKRENGFVAISMGDIGRISRVCGALVGSELIFASAGQGLKSAPGQPDAAELARILGFEV